MPRSKPPASPDQSQRFVETASALGCDEDEAAFREKLRVIARHQPKDSPAVPDKRKAKPKRSAT